METAHTSINSDLLPASLSPLPRPQPFRFPPPTPSLYRSPLPSWTYLPGLQFILAGMAGNTASFFAVPAMRLALDVIVYMGVIAVFVTQVSRRSTVELRAWRG